MHNLIFSSAKIQSGFTNASTSATNDKDSSLIIRELLQNSYDSAIIEASRETAKVKFIIDYIDKASIPGINSYEDAINSIEQENLTDREQEEDILYTIKQQLKEDKIPVLYVVDNGIGFTQNKLVAILSDGISDKDNPHDSGGSYGNGHFSTFNMSDLRYILYGGKSNDSKLCSGQALLRTHIKNEDLKLGTGFLLKEDLPIIKENAIFYTDNDIPEIINNQLDTIEDSGAIVGVLGFNFFGNEKDINNVVDLISSSVIRNFYVAIHENNLEVEIVTNEKNINITSETVDNIFDSTQDEKSNPTYNTAKQFYSMLNYGKNQTISTREGEIKIYYGLSESGTKLAICRNGMWINDSIPRPLNKNNFASNKNFNALILIQKGTNFSTLIRRIESNSHDNIKLNRFPNDIKGRQKRKRLSETLHEIKDFLTNIVEKNDNDSFEYDIPELSINMIGDARPKHQNQRKSNTTKKIPNKPKNVSMDADMDGDEDVTTNPNELNPNSKPNNKRKFRKGKPFNVGKFSSYHNSDKKEAKLKFVVDKTATNLLLCLRLEDGTDPTCDGVNNLDRLKIDNATSGGKKYEITNEDTINIGRVEKNTLINLDVKYKTNIKGDYIIDYEFLNSAPEKDVK